MIYKSFKYDPPVIEVNNRCGFMYNYGEPISTQGQLNVLMNCPTHNWRKFFEYYKQIKGENTLFVSCDLYPYLMGQTTRNTLLNNIDGYLSMNPFHSLQRSDLQVELSWYKSFINKFRTLFLNTDKHALALMIMTDHCSLHLKEPVPKWVKGLGHPKERYRCLSGTLYKRVFKNAELTYDCGTNDTEVKQV